MSEEVKRNLNNKINELNQKTQIEERNNSKIDENNQRITILKNRTQQQNQQINDINTQLITQYNDMIELNNATLHKKALSTLLLTDIMILLPILSRR